MQCDNELLSQKCTEPIKNGPPITKTRLGWRKADLAIGKAGVAATETSISAPVVFEERDVELPEGAFASRW